MAIILWLRQTSWIIKQSVQLWSSSFFDTVVDKLKLPSKTEFNSFVWDTLASPELCQSEEINVPLIGSLGLANSLRPGNKEGKAGGPESQRLSSKKKKKRERRQWGTRVGKVLGCEKLSNFRSRARFLRMQNSSRQHGSNWRSNSKQAAPPATGPSRPTQQQLN